MPDPKVINARAVAAERNRCASIVTTARTHAVPLSMVATAIKNGTAPETFRGMVLRSVNAVGRDMIARQANSAQQADAIDAERQRCADIVKIGRSMARSVAEVNNALEDGTDPETFRRSAGQPAHGITT